MQSFPDNNVLTKEKDIIFDVERKRDLKRKIKVVYMCI